MTNGAKPDVSQVLYDPGVLTVRWFPMSDPDLTGFRVFLQKQGEPEPEHQDTGPDVYVAKFQQDLSEGKYTTWVATLIGGAVGESSDPLPVITVAANMSAVVYDVSPEIGLTVHWDAVDAEGQTGYVAVLQEVKTGPTRSETTSELEVFFEGALHFNRDYNVTVRAIGNFGIIEGPSSTVYQPVLDTPTVRDLAYDVLPEAALTLRWNPVDQPPVDAYLAELHNTTDKTEVTEPTTETFAVFSGKLEESDAYKAFVRATAQDGVSRGPKSLELVPIVAQASNPALNYNGTAFPFAWTGIADVTDYEAELYENGARADQKSGPETSVTFETTLTNGTVYTARVRGVGNLVQGPWTDYAPGPYGMAVVITPDDIGRISTVEINQYSSTTYTIDDAGNVTGRATAVPDG